MGLHSKTRYMIHLQGADRTEQMRSLYPCRRIQWQPGEAYEVYSVADVLGVINLELKTPLSATKVGMLLNKLGFRKVRSNKSRGYKVYRYSVEEISHNRKGSIKDGEEQELPF